MNDRPESLLDDVLTEAAPPDLRETMLNETLRLVRRHRRRRQTRRVTALVIALGLCGIFVWQKNTPRGPAALAPVSAVKAVGKNYILVGTQPLPVGDIVTTQPLTSYKLVASAAAVEMVQTRSGDYRAINDEELLALVALHPAVLIRTGPHSEELVFANPADQKGFPLN